MHSTWPPEVRDGVTWSSFEQESVGAFRRREKCSSDVFYGKPLLIRTPSLRDKCSLITVTWENIRSRSWRSRNKELRERSNANMDGAAGLVPTKLTF